MGARGARRRRRDAGCGAEIASVARGDVVESGGVCGPPGPHRKEHDMKKYVCNVCGYVYDPEKGDPDSGIAPGTAFDDIPEDWVCPVCGVAKSDFSPVAS